MLEVDFYEVSGFYPAIIGMRHPLGSEARSDSYSCVLYDLGGKDLKLMQNLAANGPDHSKFARMIVVWMDITAPLYWWKEFDTYKVGTVSNSNSTMHTIHKKEFTIDNFEVDDDICPPNFNIVIDSLNSLREKFLDTEDRTYWHQIIKLLPESYKQTRMICTNYAVLHNIYNQRNGHKLKEWHVFCDEILKLPYFADIYRINNENPTIN